MEFAAARDELLATLVAGGWDEKQARRKLSLWTARIERRTAAHLAQHAHDPGVADVLEHVAVQLDDLAAEARAIYGGEAWDGIPAPVVAYERAASMVRKAKTGVDSV